MGRSGWFLDRKEGEAAVLPGSSGCPDSRLHPALSLPKAEHSHGHQAPTELQGCARDLMERTVRGAAQRSPPPREGCCRRARGEWGMPPPREGCRRRGKDAAAARAENGGCRCRGKDAAAARAQDGGCGGGGGAAGFWAAEARAEA